MLWTRTKAQPAATDVIPTGLLIRSIGYRGNPLPGLPFDDTHGVIEHIDGRVVGRLGSYVTGWIKRGPTGVIGTNKKCARDTVRALLDDADAGRLSTDRSLDRFAVAARLRQRSRDVVDLTGWNAIDLSERRGGRAEGRPRHKLTRVPELVAASQDSRSGGPHHYDVIVVGSGLGGLSSAACLAASGKSVRVAPTSSWPWRIVTDERISTVAISPGCISTASTCSIRTSRRSPG